MIERDGPLSLSRAVRAAGREPAVAVVKYEAVYLYELRDGPDAQRIIGSWIDFYNEARPALVAGRTDAGRGLSRRR